MVVNNRAPLDTRNILAGKDGALFDQNGVHLATMETFQAQVNITNGTYLPLGAALEAKVFLSYSLTLSMTETVIEDQLFFQQLIDGLKTHVMPNWNFQGVIRGRNGSEERMIFRSCVPDGTIDLQNPSGGDILKRAWSMAVNEPPELQSLLTVD